jgi:hypothetical protein
MSGTKTEYVLDCMTPVSQKVKEAGMVKFMLFVVQDKLYVILPLSAFNYLLDGVPSSYTTLQSEISSIILYTAPSV